MNKISIMESAVRKWNRIIARKGNDGGVWDCPPCRIFYLLFCVGCPIAGYTGKKFCRGSPYGRWYHHQNNAHGYMIRKIRCPECERLAIAMRDYMQEIVDHLKSERNGPAAAAETTGSAPDSGCDPDESRSMGLDR